MSFKNWFSFMKGFGSVLNIAPSRNYRSNNLDQGFEQDYKNLSRDWEKVGADLEKRRQKLKRGQS